MNIVGILMGAIVADCVGGRENPAIQPANGQGVDIG